MSASILELLDSENKKEILITCFEQYIRKCKSLANAPMRGYGSASERMKKEEWAIKAEEAQNLLNDLLIELT